MCIRDSDRDIDDYFGLETLKLIVRQPLALTETGEKFDVVCRVAGGGVTGQAEISRLRMVATSFSRRGICPILAASSMRDVYKRQSL